MTFSNKFIFFCKHAVVSSFISLSLFILIRNYESAFHQYHRMRNYSLLMRDISHVLRPVLISWLSIIFVISLYNIYRKRTQLSKLFTKFGINFFIFICLALIPNWGKGYWLAVFKNEYLSSLNVSIILIPGFFLASTFLIRKMLISNFTLFLAQINCFLLYFCLYGYTNFRIFHLSGPLAESFIPVISATTIWTISWIIWHKEGSVEYPALLTNRQKNIMRKLMLIALIWQFLSYFWYADTCRLQLAHRVVGNARELGGICLNNANTLPENQRKYLIAQLTDMCGKVYIDEDQFPQHKLKDKTTIKSASYKYPILQANMRANGIFLSKGICGYYIGNLGGYSAEVSAAWFLGRWWHIYTHRACTS